MQSKCKAMQSKFTRLVFVFILYNYLIINEAVVLFRYAVFTTSKIKTAKLVESLAVFRFPTVYLKHCSPLIFATNKQFLFFLRNGKTNQHLFGKDYQVVRKCALCPLQHSAQQRCCTLYR